MQSNITNNFLKQVNIFNAARDESVLAKASLPGPELDDLTGWGCGVE